MNASSKKTHLVIAGGGTAGWMSAAAFAKQMGHVVDITLVESEQIGTVGVGEATIPPLRVFHALLGLNEQEFMRATQATFKLGIEFQNWGKNGERYIHSFGKTGKECWAGEFQHFWLEAKAKGFANDFGDYCLELQAAQHGKFSNETQPAINYAYHLNATAYAKFLRTFCEKLGVVRVEGKIDEVVQINNGDISALRLESGQSIYGDFFIDCTGARSLLLGSILKTPFEKWNEWLLCDSAIALQTTSNDSFLPYTQSIAHNSGWRWRIPLQNRNGNGFVYSSEYLSSEQAESEFLDILGEAPVNEPRKLTFSTGKYQDNWSHNCVAIGLSNGFVEPLESTSIHMINSCVIRLMRLFPNSENFVYNRDEYNKQTNAEWQNIRDFIILHYKVTQREDTEFWRYCKNMSIPDTLKHRIELFKQSAQAFKADRELFRVDSWTQVMLGQNLQPKAWHPVATSMNDKQLETFLSGYAKAIQDAVKQLPTHREFISAYCAAN